MSYRKTIPQTNVINLLTDMAAGAITSLSSGTITRAANVATGTQSVILDFQPSYIIFSAVDDADANLFSDGVDNGIMSNSTRSESFSVIAVLHTRLTKSQINSIHIETFQGNGHTAFVSSTSAQGFILNWTKKGSGRAITVKYLAIK